MIGKFFLIRSGGRLCEAIPGARERILESLPDRQAEVTILPVAADAQPTPPPRTATAS